MRHSRRNVLRGIGVGALSCWVSSKAAKSGARPGFLDNAEAPSPAPDLAPSPAPRAGQPGPPMLLGTSVMDAPLGTHYMDARRNALVKSLGFSHLQTDSDHLSVNEPEPGRWDWTDADKGLAAAREAGLKWQYFPHFHWPPEWYRKTARFVPCTGLRSGRKLACMSLWSPDIVPWFDHGYAALAEHYGRGNDKLYAIYLGIHGDFGETLFPMGFHPDEKKYFGETGVALRDFWCGDDHARNDFRRSVEAKYRTVVKLNAVWGTPYPSFDAVDYPAGAYSASADAVSTPEARRYWLDFVQWYYDSMTKFTGEVCRIARKYFPNSLLQIPVGGGSEKLMYGQDTTALPKIARQYGVHVRSTHGGYKPFPQAYAAMIKRIATPSKVYGVPHWLETGGDITPERTVGRIMEALSCGNFGFWEFGQNIASAAEVFREYARFLTREKPVVDAALFFPTTHHRLIRKDNFPQRLQEVGVKLREVMDYDMVDEELIEDAGLEPYRVLVWIEGQFAEARTLQTLAAWVESGGVLVHLGGEPPQTVEGDTAPGAGLLGLAPPTAPQPGGPIAVRNTAFLRHLAAHTDLRAEATVNSVNEKASVLASVENRPAIWAMPHGKGWVIVAAGGDQATFMELVRDAGYNLSKLDPAKPDALEVDTDWDGVYSTLLATGEVILYNFTSEPRAKTVLGTTITLPPTSLRSVLVKQPDRRTFSRGDSIATPLAEAM